MIRFLSLLKITHELQQPITNNSKIKLSQTTQRRTQSIDNKSIIPRKFFNSTSFSMSMHSQHIDNETNHLPDVAEGDVN
jgi:hypothetical protein